MSVESTEPTESRAIPQNETSIRIVGVAAAAVGLEGLKPFFQQISPKTGLAFVVIQHPSPDHKSIQNESLSLYTDMHIHIARDGMEVESDTIYLLPPGKSFALRNNQLWLTEPLSVEADYLIPTVTNPSMPALQQDDSDALLALLLERVRAMTNIDFTFYTKTSLLRRIDKRRAITGMPTLADYVELVQEQEEEVCALRQDLLIHVTHFFRDPEAFGVIREQVLPSLILDKLRDQAPELRYGRQAARRERRPTPSACSRWRLWSMRELLAA